MDNVTLSALMDNKIRYFVYGLINLYHILSYPKLSTLPSLVWLSNGNIWALPISLETYNSPWFSIKNMIDSAILQIKTHAFKHITFLCHPFRYGHLYHIDITEKLIKYLTDRGLKSVTLKELVESLNNKIDHFPKIDNLGIYHKTKKMRVSLPRTRQDFLGLIPENLLLAYRIIRRGHTMF